MIRLTGLVTQKPVNTVYTKNEIQSLSKIKDFRWVEQTRNGKFSIGF